ncbi:TPA: ATP-dependent zinc protease family protein [Photobacterium damselae]
MKKGLLSTLILLSAVTFGANAASSCDGKEIVGQVETIRVNNLDMDYEARIDTGAATTSINAYDIKVLGSDNSNMRDNLGEQVKFKTKNEKGQVATYKGKIIRVSKIRNAQGVERRYAVVMDLELNGKNKAVAVNLRNRSKLEYKLLIGRNWLNDDYLVDVSIHSKDKH